MMHSPAKISLIILTSILTVLLIAACVPGKQGGFSCSAAPLLNKIKPQTGQSTAQQSKPAQTAVPKPTGKITTGQSAELASQPVGASGGTIKINHPGNPLDGLQLDVPAGAYPAERTFKIASAPISGHTFSKDFNPITPLISIEGSGGSDAAPTHRF